jgi:hypothetical protein
VIVALLLAAAHPVPAPVADPNDPYAGTVIEGERDLARRTGEVGRWEALREAAVADAFLFDPRPVPAQTILLNRRRDPAEPQRLAASAYVSCDNGAAVTTGPTRSAGARPHGFFTTVWRMNDEGWRWVIDSGGALATARPPIEKPVIERAACSFVPRAALPPRPAGADAGRDMSPDRTLVWTWSVDPAGVRRITVRLWTGEAYRTVVDDVVAPEAAAIAPAPAPVPTPDG